MNASRRATARNALVATGTAGALAWLLLYPTSTAGRPATAAASDQVVLARGVGGELRVQGPVVASDFGPVQVLLFYGDEILAVEVPIYPSDSLASKTINAEAIPRLVEQSFRDQRADVDSISGATQTSEAYRTSLQAALDAAHAAPTAEDDAGDHAGHSDGL